MDEHLKPLGLRVSSGAELLGCSESTVRRMLKSGELEGFRVRAGVRVDYDDLVRYVRTHRYLGVEDREVASILRRLARLFPRYRRANGTSG
jgi:excisionase family DNA binding protein